jgi:uncharacterized protein YcaQ
MAGRAVRLTRVQARRLAYRGQRLSGPRIGRDRDSLLGLVRDLGCLQLDPIAVVARSHLLVTWSRVGRFDQDVLRQLQEAERQLFEYWAHAASLVPTSDLPLHRVTMARMTQATGRATMTHRRVHDWLIANEGVQAELLAALERDGPLRTQDLSDFAVPPWRGGGWSNERTVVLMLEVLSHGGVVLVSRRDGTTRWWDIARRCLPPDAPTDVMSETAAVRVAAVRAIRALGAATATQVKQHFIRGRYPGLTTALDTLVADGEIVPTTVEGLKGSWYVHADDLSALDELAPARLTLLSPFDNLICDRARTEALWDFECRLEIYTPAAKRRWGYYVLPILDGDRLVGRVDAAVDRQTELLTALATYTERGVRPSTRRDATLTRRFDDLARFVGARGATGLSPLG